MRFTISVDGDRSTAEGGPESARRTMTRRAWLKALVAGGVGAATALGAYGVYERHAIGLTRVELPVAGLPPALAGLRIGLITDVHRSRWVLSRRCRRRAVDAAAWRRSPISSCSAATTSPGATAQFVGPVGRGAAPRSRRRTASSASSATTTTITTCRRRSSAQRRPDAEGRADDADASAASRSSWPGIRFWTRRAADIAPLLRGATGTVVLLAHDPRRLTEAAALNIPLVLSGHTHGGQVVLPGVGAVAARKFPVVAGHRHARDRRRSSSAAASGRSTCRCGSTARRKSRS